MNLPDLTPTGQIRKVGKLIAIAVAVVISIIGALVVMKFVGDPFGFGKRKTETAQATATVNGQQAASNAAGAAINDNRAGNVARLDRTAQEGQNAIWRADDLDAAYGSYLAHLECLRDQGRAPVAVRAADDRGPDAGAEPDGACEADAAASDQP
jgi:hypothetical protein